MIRENRKVECAHEGYIAEKHVYCPDCGETGNEMVLQKRIAELEYYNLGLANESCAQQEKIRELEARAIELPPTHEPSEFVTDVDGYVYYWPHGSTGGHYAAHHLRRIATELDDRNREWHNQIMNDPVLGGGEK